METLKALDTIREEMTRIGKSVVIKGELSCSEDLYIDGQVEGTIEPKGNRLMFGPTGASKPTSVLAPDRSGGEARASLECSRLG
jgi:hypothetical protein